MGLARQLRRVRKQTLRWLRERGTAEQARRDYSAVGESRRLGLDIVDDR